MRLRILSHIETQYIKQMLLFGFRSAIGNSVQQVSNLPSPRFIKSHLPLQLLPVQLGTVNPKVRMANNILT